MWVWRGVGGEVVEGCEIGVHVAQWAWKGVLLLA